MAKRFIDTGLFEDEWFADLSLKGKLFWIYYITKCDHAGLLKYNKKLIEFHVGISDAETVIKELDNRLVRVHEHLFFCPAFIRFQYPDFPKSNVKQQQGAIKLLRECGLLDEDDNFKTSLTLNKELPNSYDNDNDNDNGTVIEEQKPKTEKHRLIKFIESNYPIINKMNQPLTNDQCDKLIETYKKESIKTVLASMANKPNLKKDYSSTYLTANNWLKRMGDEALILDKEAEAKKKLSMTFDEYYKLFTE